MAAGVPPAPAIDQRHLGAAASALVSATIGEIAVVFSRSSATKHYALVDIEWLILPAVFNRQCYVAQAAHKESGLRAPLAVATGAFVSSEVDQKLSADLSRRIRLRPDEWKCGEIAWIVDLVGEPRGVASTIDWLRAGPFRERDAKLIMRDASGLARVSKLGESKLSELGPIRAESGSPR